ncbi:ABC transporter permease [Nocardioides speluncae]|uniref:ABC transporter permease n=1 Tax=Nocardioides speluncae TaxID=2670337 RepID=UPI000D68F9C9|nr:ABC-2 family transporter protein [Nocardioides speluncae]
MLHLSVAVSSFRRYSTYRAATIAGAFTNSVFGIIMCFVYLAVWERQPDAGGYDASDAVTYVWLGQAMLAALATFGGGAPDDLAARIKSGDVAIDFYRPVDILGWYLAADLGRAAFQLLTRGLAPTLVGIALFDIRLPPGPVAWLGFAAAVVLAVVVSYALRMLVALSTFWLLDDTGPRTLAMVVAVFLGGMTVPLVLFPDGLREVAMALPWVAYLQVPADIWLGQRAGTELLAGLALAAAWAAVLLAVAALVLRAAERRVVVQGG